MEKDLSDETLMSELASGRQEAIGALYSRYAPTVLGMAAQALDRPTAEEIVQDVFLAVWKNARAFDSSRGPVRPWLLQIAHYRIANELRRRSRRPKLQSDADPEQFVSIPDPGPDQSEEVWKEYRHSALRRALEELPPPQRQALGLAFFEQLSHNEVASALALPLGTAKSRIRSGLRALRVRLAPLVAILAGIAILGAAALRLHFSHLELSRDERALTVLTSSSAQSVRLTSPGASRSRIHGHYWYVAGSPMAVLTSSYFPPAPSGQVYRGWALHGGAWHSLGELRPDASGYARQIVEHSALATRPDKIEITLEQEIGGSTPSGSVVIAWPQ
jgi:RNA polymerase sigma-70 factor (ECF subfamily)